MDIFQAVEENNVDYVREYLENNGDPNAHEDWAEVTLLHLAIDNHCDEVAIVLIDYGADMFARDKLIQQTPLALAAQEGAYHLLAFMNYFFNLLQEYYLLCFQLYSSIKCVMSS